MADTQYAHDPPTWTGPSGSYEDIEQRLQRLEDAVAAICDTQQMEDRVANRVVEQLASRTAAANPEQPPIAAYVPPPAPVSRTPTSVARDLFHAAASSPEAIGLLGEIWWDVRTLWAMLFDHFYQITWLGRIVPIAALLYVLIWPLISTYVLQMPSLPVIGFVDDLVVLYLGFKVTGRELRRYREFLARQGR